MVEYSLRVDNNAEGGIAFLMVGELAAGEKWHTLGPPGTDLSSGAAAPDGRTDTEGLVS